MDDREPRTGLPGLWDRLVGPGATATENAGAAALMGADLSGGVWANATPAPTRWYRDQDDGTGPERGWGVAAHGGVTADARDGLVRPRATFSSCWPATRRADRTTSRRAPPA